MDTEAAPYDVKSKRRGPCSSRLNVAQRSFGAAGTYPDIRLFVSDGLHTVSTPVTILIAPANQAPGISSLRNTAQTSSALAD